MRLPGRIHRRRNESSGPPRPPGQQWQRPELVIWGAHGGAGTSTLAVWLQPAWDMGAMRPEPNPRYPADVAHGRALLVVCRNTAWSAAQAARALEAVTSQGGHVAVLAVVSDGRREPATASQSFRFLEARAGAVVRIPFIRRMRRANDPVDALPPRKARRALADVQAATGRNYPIRHQEV